MNHIKSPTQDSDPVTDRVDYALKLVDSISMCQTKMYKSYNQGNIDVAMYLQLMALSAYTELQDVCNSMTLQEREIHLSIITSHWV